MKFLRNFDIDIIRLKDGEHTFPFEVNSDFFGHFPVNDLVSEGNLKVSVTLKKQGGVIEAWFEIQGQVKLTCDRSLEEYLHDLKTRERILYKYGPEEGELNEEVYLITNETAQINVAQFIYEFILLAIPPKKLHPKFGDEEEDSDEGVLVYSSITEESEKEFEPETNPLWEKLKKLKK
ncbi:protein in cluster with ribosomal protein L32p, Bacteroidetes/Chlorobi subfamily [Lunatimonas lonarensis]|uniref:Protein in cluster with ribosomal protein L32p, Bacteroidetes/Chlorobi subfamily n=1 Tax=Lunatimonas lonarensis TaxID=1232681 RepID=R7ZT13_9BACT|nr:DUF177 domain-containing protein [Lunatimonas lonarensis]EON77173.1 protein in cluster with ribosomal protein L32p, Bacteroidetes/Chlorobi subfamily [Lunatimonas lonarensis]